MHLFPPTIAAPVEATGALVVAITNAALASEPESACVR